MLVSFWLGLAVGMLHWRFFLFSVKALQGSAQAGKSKLRRISVALSWARFAVTGALLWLLVQCGFSVPSLLAGVLFSGFVFRMLSLWRGNKV
jgi:hypothetical protein